MPGRPVDVCTTRRSVLDVGGPVALLVLITDKIGLKRNSCVCRVCVKEKESVCMYVCVCEKECVNVCLR